MTDLAKLRELQSDPHSGLAFMAALVEYAPALLDEVEKLRAALREVVAASQTQLESHGKGIEPSQRLADAFNAARQALGSAK